MILIHSDLIELKFVARLVLVRPRDDDHLAPETEKRRRNPPTNQPKLRKIIKQLN